MSFFLSFIYALFLWWFTTGAIFVFYGRSRRTIRIGFSIFSVLMILALASQWGLKGRTDTTSIFLSVTAGVIVWGWQVASYYLGYITGPKSIKYEIDRVADTDGDRSMTLATRFKLAAMTGIYHELIIVLFILVQLWLTRFSPNQWGVWVFVGLWLMHTCGKISVFLGVRNFQIDFLPDHLAYVGRLLLQGDTNPFLKISIFVGSAVGIYFYSQIGSQFVTSADQIGFGLVGTMILLGVVELGLLVMPIPATLLGWEIRKLDPVSTHEVTPGAD